MTDVCTHQWSASFRSHTTQVLEHYRFSLDIECVVVSTPRFQNLPVITTRPSKALLATSTTSVFDTRGGLRVYIWFATEYPSDVFSDFSFGQSRKFPCILLRRIRLQRLPVQTGLPRPTSASEVSMTRNKMGTAGWIAGLDDVYAWGNAVAPLPQTSFVGVRHGTTRRSGPTRKLINPPQWVYPRRPPRCLHCCCPPSN